MEALSDYAKQLAQIWDNMSKRQRGALVGLVSVVLLGLAWITVGQRPHAMQILFADLEPADAAAIRDALSARKEPFELADQGTSIRVMQGRVHTLRLDLTAEGLPRGGGVGFEIFDKSGLAMSQFLQNVNFRRALEGELSRTVGSLNEVRSARIHLVIPKRRVFSDEQQRPTASVVLHLGGGGLGTRTVKGIAHLIASAVEGMQARDVTILDQLGSVLQRAQTGEGFEAMSQYEEQVRGREKDLERRITVLLEPMLGVGNIRVQANMEYDFDAVQSTKDLYDPERQVVRSEERTEEEREIEGARAAQGGQAGAEANEPGGEGSVAAAGGASKTKRGTERSNYEIDKTTEVVVRQSAILKRMSIAVLVNASAASVAENAGEKAQSLSEAELKQIRDLVASASGFNDKRGDAIQVVQSPFQTNGLEMPEAAMDLAGMMPMVQGVVALIIALMVVFMVVRPLLAQLGEIRPELVDAAALPGTVEDVAKRLEEAEREAAGRKMLEQRNSVVEYASEEPEKTAEILRGWLGEG
ncbi:MAG: flagellar basal-body MS-ring/collar protein FliF [Myxococcota bacterium]|nr:flagellar basal-body MS-ring/collar protein FliF [Myxococcota bacterium]